MKSIRELVTQVYSESLDGTDEKDFEIDYEVQDRGVDERWRVGHEDIGATGPYDYENSPSAMISTRIHAIAAGVIHTCNCSRENIDRAVKLVVGWIENRTIVRVLGAGRALLAGSMPGNRLAHAGAQVSFMGGMVPMPNSRRGGGIIACSASGKTGAVLQAMEIAKKNADETDQTIKILGIASHDATQFKELCDVFIGIHVPKSEYPNPLSALADTEEYVISELLDGLVVMAGKEIGFDDNGWRRGHEDIGPTGPYAPH